MFIQEKVPLQAYSTMRLGGQAAYLSEVNDRQEIPELVNWALGKQLPIIMVGSGSNIIWRDEGFSGLILVNKILGTESYDLDEQTTFITASSGENWDKFVESTTDKGLYGIELLSLIPGTAGAAPVQNIGAYGGQLSDVLSTIEAYDLSAGQFVTLRASECSFGYRTSRFKHADRNRYLITKITVQLSKVPTNKSTYHSLESYMKTNNITERTSKNIRDAVIAIRSEKLPDPALVANCGSFFANPIIDKDYSSQLLDGFPRLASWPTKFMWDLPDGTVKIAAGALLEHEGFKGFHDPETGMATWDNQALVLVNEHAKNTADLLKFKQKITSSIQDKFGIVLEQEPELLP